MEGTEVAMLIDHIDLVELAISIFTISAAVLLLTMAVVLIVDLKKRR
jgi:hypothetical protein